MSKKEKNLEHVESAPIEELEELKAFWGKFGNYICIGLLVVVVAVMVGRKIISDKEATHQEAMKALNEAVNPEKLEVLIQSDQSSYVTPLAMLRLGTMYFEQKEYDLAVEKFNKFITEYSDHKFIKHAKYNLAVSYEAQGKFDDAIRTYSELFDQNIPIDEALEKKGNAFAKDAILGKIRCLILKGDKDGGKQLLDVIIAHNAENGRKEENSRFESLSNAINRLENPPLGGDVLSLFNESALVPDVVPEAVPEVAPEAVPEVAPEAVPEAAETPATK